jgi:2-keto-4-pentenoate hydratase
VTYFRQERSPLSAITLGGDTTPATLADAYAGMAVEIAREPVRWGAWKLGGTNYGGQAAFNVTRGYFGAIDRSEILLEPAIAPGFPLFEIKGEVEVALRIAADGQSFDAWCVCLEMPSSPITNLLEAGVNALVADRCAAGALLLGAEKPVSSLSETENAHFTLEIDGEAASVGTLADLVASPAACLDDFLALAAETGFAPKAGDWVATGGITKCIAFKPGAQVRVLFNEEAVLDFTASLTGA